MSADRLPTAALIRELVARGARLWRGGTGFTDQLSLAAVPLTRETRAELDQVRQERAGLQEAIDDRALRPVKERAAARRAGGTR